mmetsp:Transcript_69398/g.129605  ORF Transcript_69398/g.129605 Transcript_69398/m.129605 type:complete len:80 (+) Transcript_69398:111-350(+)
MNMIEGTRAATNPQPRPWLGKEAVVVVQAQSAPEGFSHNQSFGRALGGSIVRHPDVRDCTVTNMNHIQSWQKAAQLVTE